MYEKQMFRRFNLELKKTLRHFVKISNQILLFVTPLLAGESLSTVCLSLTLVQCIDRPVPLNTGLIV